MENKECKNCGLLESTVLETNKPCEYGFGSVSTQHTFEPKDTNQKTVNILMNQIIENQEMTNYPMKIFEKQDPIVQDWRVGLEEFECTGRYCDHETSEIHYNFLLSDIEKVVAQQVSKALEEGKQQLEKEMTQYGFGAEINEFKRQKAHNEAIITKIKQTI